MRADQGPRSATEIPDRPTPRRRAYGRDATPALAIPTARLNLRGATAGVTRVCGSSNEYDGAGLIEREGAALAERSSATASSSANRPDPA